MNLLYKDGMSIIMKKIAFFCGCIMIILLFSALSWGTNVISLIQGPQPFENVASLLQDQKQEHSELKNAYVSVSIDMITGSYAQYGEVKENQTANQTVYYLMPVDNGSYFITVIAYGDSIPSLDAMEEAFYNSIGQDDKEYPETVILDAGFRQLNDEELTYALDYFSAYDETITTKDQLPQILSPYAIVIGEIGSIQVTSLWTLFIGWCTLAFVCVIGLILYYSKFFMRTLQKDLDVLSEEQKQLLDDDYKKATAFDHLKIGENLLYKKEAWTWHVWDYSTLIWVYKKEILSAKQRKFEVCAYVKDGKKLTLWIGDDEKKAQKLLQKIFDHCPNALMGYESYIYEYWKEQPKQLYKKLKELNLLKQKEEKVKQKKGNKDKKEKEVDSKNEIKHLEKDIVNHNQNKKKQKNRKLVITKNQNEEEMIEEPKDQDHDKLETKIE